MPLFIVPRPDLVPCQTLVIAHMRPGADLAKVAACVFAVAVEVVLVYGVEMLRWEGCEIRLAHDLLPDVVDAVTCRGGED